MGPPCCRWCSNSRMNFMNQRLVATFLLLAPAALFGADSQWVLGASTLSYLVSHPLHESVGVSHEARGKGVCHAGQCDFLIAAPVKSFDSKDSNRDLHMLQVKIPVAVLGIERLHRRRDQEIALPGVANALAARLMAHPHALMQRMRHKIRK